MILNSLLGITIPDITAVIDTGKEKVMRYVKQPFLLYSILIKILVSTSDARYRSWLKFLLPVQMQSSVEVGQDESRKEYVSTCSQNIDMINLYVLVPIVANTWY